LSPRGAKKVLLQSLSGKNWVKGLICNYGIKTS
jgi:hypothetical protein